MPSDWTVRSDITDETASVAHALDRLLSLRGIDDPAERERFLSPDYDRDLHDPFLFSSMRRVIDRFRFAQDAGERIGLFGDFDADGITSSVLMREAFSRLGIPVSVYLPDKHTEGHGLSSAAVDRFTEDGVSLIVTVDCGTSDHETIAEAKRRGMETIVVDHHHAPETLPDAYAFINPRIPGETYPFPELCGAGLSFKVLQAVYATFFPDERDRLKWFLDVAAVGTVADVMPLIGENRVIVAYGLIVLSKSRRHGFREMLARMRIREGQVPVARDIAFTIAPRLNAASRMAHAKTAHDLLMEEDPEQAGVLATTLESYNTDRKKVSDSIAKKVRLIAKEDAGKRFVFAADEAYHFGVVGLVAGRIASEFGKPTIILTKGESVSRGSLRSVPGFDIIGAVGECGDLLERFGGHAQAAGLTVRNEHLDELRERLERIASERLSDIRSVDPETVADMRLDPRWLTLDFSRSLNRLAPFGEGNPEPVFLVESGRVIRTRPVGSDGKHLKLSLSFPDGRVVDAIGFSLADRIPDLSEGDTIDVLCRLGENEWNGSTNLQLGLVDMRRNRKS